MKKSTPLLAAATCTMVLGILLGKVFYAPVPSAPPKPQELPFTSFLDRTDLRTSSFTTDANKSSTQYRYALALDSVFSGYIEPGRSTNSMSMATQCSTLLRYEFVPEMMWPEGTPPPTDEERKNERRITKEAVVNFWRPWVQKLYGNEGAYYRVKFLWSNPRMEPGKRYAFDELSQEDWNLLQQAVQGNDPYALYLSGRIFYEKIASTPEQDQKKGWQQLLAAADAGCPDAQKYVSNICIDGQGRPADYDCALHYATLAFDNGQLGAAHHLYRIYKDGLGVPLDYEKIYYYAVLTGDPFGDDDGKPITDATLKERLRQEAFARARAARAKPKEEKQKLVERWLAMVPDIKKDIYDTIPWLAWTMASDAERAHARAAFLEQQAGKKTN